MKFKGDLLITDPCYVKDLFVYPIASRDTIYGDWSCMVYPGKFGENEKFEEWDNYYLTFFNHYNFDGLSEEEKQKLLQKNS